MRRGKNAAQTDEARRPEQSKRFIETAEEVGADTDDEALERAFKKIMPTPPKGRENPK